MVLKLDLNRERSWNPLLTGVSREAGQMGAERLSHKWQLPGVSGGMPQGTSEPQISFHHFPRSLQSGLAFIVSVPDISHQLNSPEPPYPQSCMKGLTILHISCTEFLPEDPGRAVPLPGEAVNCGDPLALSLSQDQQFGSCPGSHLGSKLSPHLPPIVSVSRGRGEKQHSL